VESFGARLRDELLAVEAFNTLLEAQVLVEDWRIEYNTVRPTAPWDIAPDPVRPSLDQHPPPLSYQMDHQTGLQSCTLGFSAYQAPPSSPWRRRSDAPRRGQFEFGLDVVVDRLEDSRGAADR
jgi:hypothetical protein